MQPDRQNPRPVKAACALAVPQNTVSQIRDTPPTESLSGLG